MSRKNGHDVATRTNALRAFLPAIRVHNNINLCYGARTGGRSPWGPGDSPRHTSPIHRRRARAAFFITAYLLLSRTASETLPQTMCNVRPFNQLMLASVLQVLARQPRKNSDIELRTRSAVPRPRLAIFDAGTARAHRCATAKRVRWRTSSGLIFLTGAIPVELLS